MDMVECLLYRCMNRKESFCDIMTSNVLNLNNLRLAMLIDAENISHKHLKCIMEEIALYGSPTIKRIYGDWTQDSMDRWKAPLLENAITPIQQYSYTSGKNSSDSALIIDAMDVLYTARTDGFVIVSSDSDFTRLAIRLREAGQRVIGVGEKKTPNAFIAACDKFIYIEVIRKNAQDSKSEDSAHDHAAEEHVPEEHASDGHAQKGAAAARGKLSPIKPKTVQPKVPVDIVSQIAVSISDLAGDDEWVFLGELGNLLQKKMPDFDQRNYGFRNLSSLMKSIDRFELDFRQTSDNNIKHPYVRDRQAQC